MILYDSNIIWLCSVDQFIDLSTTFSFLDTPVWNLNGIFKIQAAIDHLTWFYVTWEILIELLVWYWIIELLIWYWIIELLIWYWKIELLIWYWRIELLIWYWRIELLIWYWRRIHCYHVHWFSSKNSCC